MSEGKQGNVPDGGGVEEGEGKRLKTENKQEEGGKERARQGGSICKGFEKQKTTERRAEEGAHQTKCCELYFSVPTSDNIFIHWYFVGDILTRYTVAIQVPIPSNLVATVELNHVQSKLVSCCFESCQQQQ